MPNICEERIRKWRDKLIDLSKRNRLLNFRPTKVTTIRITDELPSEILSILAIEKEGMEFLPIETSKEDLFKENEDSKEELTAEFKKYKKDEVEEKHKDKYLQTDLTKDKLPKNLFRIYSKANSVMEEQGYNVLFLTLGCLEWYESEESNIKLKAPIILVPIELTRTSVRSKFKLKYHEEEQLILNPALILKLQNDFGIKVEAIDEDLENIDPQQIFSQIQEAIRKNNRWRITNDIYLSLFSFAKFIMYKDIEKYLSVLLNNSIIKMICGQPAEEKVSLGLFIEEKDLDRVLVPLKTFQILDADSSQQQAILAVKGGENLVIEGPPGTGKSQTIANIISEFLAEGKKVLFVSQKMAALEVVKKRLDNNRLGDFCLELHSRKANKNEVIKELVRVLEMQKKPDHANDEEISKLEKIRNELNNYVKDIHTPFGNLEMTPFQAFGIITSHPEIKDIAFVFRETEGWDRKKFNLCCDLLDNLTFNLSKISDPSSHPWCSSRLTSIHYAEKLKLGELIEAIIENHLAIQNYVERLARNTFFNEPSSIADIEILMEANKLLQDTPSVTKSMLANQRWNCLSPEIEGIIGTVKLFNELKSEINIKYNFNEFIREISDIEAIISRYQHYFRNPLMLLTPSFWKDRRLLKKFIINKKYRPNLKKIIVDLEKIKESKQALIKITNNEDLGKELFGELWKGKDTNWESIDNFSKWIIKFRQYVIKKYFVDSVFEELKRGKVDKQASIAILNSLSVGLSKLKEDTNSFFDLAKIDEAIFLGTKLNLANLLDTMKKITILKENIDAIENWTRYQEALEECENFGLKDFVGKILSLKIPFEKIVDTFKCQFLKCWIDAVFTARPTLKKFRGEDHEKLIQKFCELDERCA
jgi:DNA polymerase III delta prime subunit